MKYLLENLDLMTYKINFNYQKKAKYHSFFSMFVSMCIYVCTIILTKYFSEDFINQSNPRVIYQETELTDNFTLPINFILKSYYYMFEFETSENIYNLTIDEEKKFLTSEENNFFSLYLTINKLNFYNNSITLNMIDTISINSERMFENGKEKFKHYVYKNVDGHIKFNLTMIDIISQKILKEEKGILSENFNITIEKDVYLEFYIDSKRVLDNDNQFRSQLNFENLDNIINVNNKNFFKNYSVTEYFEFDKTFFIPESSSFNYGCVKLIDEAGFIFSESSEKFSLKKNYESRLSNKRFSVPGASRIFTMEINPVMKQYQRIYRKLQNVFADLGGLFNSLILIGNILVAQFNQKKFEYDLINKTFYNDNDSDNNHEQKEIKIKTINLNTQNNNENLDIENINLKINDNDNNPNSEEKDEPINSIQCSFNKDENKSIEPTDGLANKNPLNSNKDIIKEISELTNNEKNNIYKDLIKENNPLNKNINSPSLKVKNIELKQINIIKDKKSDVNQNKKNIDFSDSIESNKILKEKVELFFEKNRNNKSIRKKFVNLSRFEFLLKFIPCKRIKSNNLIHKELLILKAEKEITKYLDICSYTNLYENFEKLKLTLLNNYHIVAFENLKNRNTTDIFKENYIDRIIGTVQYFKQKQKESNLNDLDAKLLENLNSEFKELIYN